MKKQTKTTAQLENSISRLRRAIYVVAALFVLIAADHVTKWIAIASLKESSEVYVFLGNLFRLQYAENTGAFLSLGAGLPDGIRSLIMTGLNGVILAGLIAYLFAARRIPIFPAIALTLIAGGGIGNLIDRIFRDGRVVDFMNMGITTNGFSLRTGVFNIADVAIMAGLFLIIAHELLNIRKHSDNAIS